MPLKTDKMIFIIIAIITMQHVLAADNWTDESNAAADIKEEQKLG